MKKHQQQAAVVLGMISVPMVFVAITLMPLNSKVIFVLILIVANLCIFEIITKTIKAKMSSTEEETSTDELQSPARNTRRGLSSPTTNSGTWPIEMPVSYAQACHNYRLARSSAESSHGGRTSPRHSLVNVHSPRQHRDNYRYDLLDVPSSRPHRDISRYSLPDVHRQIQQPSGGGRPQNRLSSADVHRLQQLSWADIRLLNQVSNSDLRRLYNLSSTDVRLLRHLSSADIRRLSHSYADVRQPRQISSTDAQSLNQVSADGRRPNQPSSTNMGYSTRFPADSYSHNRFSGDVNRSSQISAEVHSPSHISSANVYRQSPLPSAPQPEYQPDSEPPSYEVAVGLDVPPPTYMDSTKAELVE